MLPITAQAARTRTEELARSALPDAPTRHLHEAHIRPTAPSFARCRLADALRRVADRLEPVTP